MSSSLLTRLAKIVGLPFGMTAVADTIDPVTPSRVTVGSDTGWKGPRGRPGAPPEGQTVAIGMRTAVGDIDILGGCGLSISRAL